MTTLHLSKASAAKIRTDALIVGVVKTDKGPQVTADAVAAAFGRTFAKTLTGMGVKGSPGEVVKIPGAGAVKSPLVVLVGLGDADEVTEETLRRAVGAGVRSLAGVDTASVAVPADTAERVAAAAEGALLGGYLYDRYLSDSSGPPVGEVTILTELVRDDAALAGVERATAVVAAVNAARTWVNTPPGDLTPPIFADEIVAAAEGTRVEVDVLDETRLEKLGYGGILGVGRGSAHPPRLATLSYTPSEPVAHIALVGKGITFDSGGISIKPSASMYTMKCDMAGAAAVVAATFAIAELGLPVRVTTYASLAENLPSGTATLPGDVLTMYGGKTVEVLNTDAEGRLVLADAIATASELQPDLIVDVATLTGACVVALGDRTGGIMANDDEFRSSVHASAETAGESMWPLPLPEEMAEKVKASKIADLSQIQSERWGGALFAGAFLREFVGEGITWAHLDIAGTAFNEGKPWGYTPKGGTGFAVRTLVQLATDRANGSAPAAGDA